MSHFLDTTYKRKSAAITSVIMSLLLVVIFFFGMKYLDPPIEYGIAVNFGISDVGMGTIQPDAPLKAATEQVVEQEQEKVEEVVEEVEPEISEEILAVSEDVATQETEEAIAIKKAAEKRKKADDLAEKNRVEEERVEKAKQAEIARQQAEKDAKRKKLDALIGGVSNSDGTATGGEGNDNQAGDKGKITGDPNASGYYGNGGTGNGGDYQLGKRKPLSKPKPNYICDEEGLVIVEIEVDRSGKVIKATGGKKGSTNNTPCLIEQSEKAAKATKWSPDNNARDIQIGFIKYRFERN